MARAASSCNALAIATFSDYCSVLHVNKMICHNDVPTKVVCRVNKTNLFAHTVIIIIIKPRLTRHMSVTKEDESQARGHEIVYG